MKKALLFLTFIFFAIIFWSIDQRPVFSAHNTNDLCLGIYGKVTATNWPGGRITVSCSGTLLSRNPDPNCPGNSASLMPGQDFDFGSCSCPPWAEDGCLKINGLPPGCTSNPASGDVCGTNGQTINRNVQITCPAPTATPTRTPGRTSPCRPLGDVNNDGVINQRDIDDLNNHIVGAQQTRSFYEEHADVNGDRIVDNIDLQIILQFLNGSISTFPACAQPSPTPVVPACNVDCERDDQCAGARDGCTDCNPTTNTCQVPLTPAPVPACGVVCETPADCQGARDSCTSCIDNACQVPPTTLNTPIPTQPPAAPTSTPAPTSIPPPTATPTPAFDPDSCKCDQIEYTTLFSGQPTTITSYGKVEGADVSKSQIIDQEFFLYEGAETTATRIMQSGPIPATIDSQSASKVRYKSVWNVTLPLLKSGATYRIQSVINCQPKITAFNTQAQSPAVLATESQNMSFLNRILDFFNRLFGGGRGTPVVPIPTITPFTSTDVSSSDVPTPTIRKQLQLEPIYPLEVYQKSCSFIKFRNNF